MALINCPECGKEISDSVKKCPHCGKKIKDNRFKEFIFKHKIIFGLFIIICVFAIGIGIYIGTHEFLSYEENVVLTAIDHVKNSSAYKESVYIQRVQVAYCTPEKIKMIYNEIPTFSSYESMNDAYTKNITSVYIYYKSLGQNDQMIENYMLCLLDEKYNILFSVSSADEHDDFSSFADMLNWQITTKEFHLVKKDVIQRISKIDRKKKIIVTDKFPEFSSEDLWC